MFRYISKIHAKSGRGLNRRFLTSASVNMQFCMNVFDILDLIFKKMNNEELAVLHKQLCITA